MIDLTPVLQAVVSLAATIVTVMVIPYIRSKTTTEQQTQLKSWAHIGVAAAEQIYPKPGYGKLKKNYVLQFLNQRGFTVDNDTLDALIESEVNQLWSNEILEVEDASNA